MPLCGITETLSDAESVRAVHGENFADDSVMQYQNTIRGFDAMVDGSVDLFFTAHPSKEQLKSVALQDL